MSSFEILGSVIAFLLGSILQSAVGFGAGLLAIPILIWVGVALPKAIAIMLGVVTLHAGYNSALAYKDIRWKPIVPMTLLRWASIPIGVFLLETFLLDNRAAAKRAVGLVMLLSLLMTARTTAEPRPSLPKAWMWLTGIASGILAGAVGLGGPPLILYALCHDWTNERTKAYLWVLYLLGSPVVVLVMWWRLGDSALFDALIGMAHAPVVWLGTHIGLLLTKTHSRDSLRRISFAALLAIAILSIVAPGLGV